MGFWFKKENKWSEYFLQGNLGKKEGPTSREVEVSDGFNRFLNKHLSHEKWNWFKFLFLFRKVFLTTYKRSCASQFGEDVVLKTLIRKNIKNGFFVDVGCYHPKKYSNTYRLYKKGWRGINIDVDQIKIDAFNMVRSKDCNIVAAISDQPGTVQKYNFGNYSVVTTIDKNTAMGTKEKITKIQEMPTRTLDDVIADTPFSGRRIDILSVDTEGHDLQVLRSLSFEKYDPRLVLVESHLSCVDKILNSDIHGFLTERNYKMINWTGRTLFYATRDNGLTHPNIP